LLYHTRKVTTTHNTPLTTPTTNFAYLREDLRVTQDDKTVSCTGQGDVETARVIQETDALMFVGTHARENDVVLLSALEGVHRCHLDFFV